MSPLLIVLLIAFVVALGALLYVTVLRARTERRDDGVARFQRHLDALSPEARRQVIDRVKKGDR